jgi:hypothetical protein
MVEFIHPLLRRLFWPFYSFPEVLCSLVLLVIFFLFITLFLEAELAPLSTLGAAVGIVYVSSMASPARLIRPCTDADRVEKFLACARYAYAKDRHGWLPPLPRWALWRHNVIKLRVTDDRLIVTGPYNALRAVQSHLAADESTPSMR